MIPSPERMPEPQYVAFVGDRMVGRGALRYLAAVLSEGPASDRGRALIFNTETSEPADIDFDGTLDQVLASVTDQEKLGQVAPRGRGRPRIGVVAREVTLLPRHWEWLGAQPGGASVALRRLVDDARRVSGPKDRIRNAQEATYRFMTATLGNERGFEEALRALFAGDGARFAEWTEGWPTDLRDHARALAREAVGQRPVAAAQGRAID